mmetsp:Transcript_13059/g.54705  ORF Transcript_13059/g.54705 Transcript_13059/m.54705 type:complete len:206 (-) Transcript_13059:451-1068(-)
MYGHTTRTSTSWPSAVLLPSARARASASCPASSFCCRSRSASSCRARALTSCASVLMSAIDLRAWRVSFSANSSESVTRCTRAATASRTTFDSDCAASMSSFADSSVETPVPSESPVATSIEANSTMCAAAAAADSWAAIAPSAASSSGSRPVAPAADIARTPWRLLFCSWMSAFSCASCCRTCSMSIGCPGALAGGVTVGAAGA